MKSNLSNRKCLEHMNKQVVFACYNKFCKEKRLVCQNCLLLHTAHVQDFINDEQIEEKVQFSISECKQLIKQLKDKFDELTLLFRKLITQIEKQFQISIDMMNRMENQQLNEYLNSLIIQEQQQLNLNQIFTDGCSYLKDKIILCQNDLGLKDLNYIDITKEEMEKAEVYYQQGYIYYDKYEYGNAIKQFDLALDLNRNHLNSIFCKGDSLKMLGQYKESIKWFDKALLIDQKYQLALFSKGDSLRMLGQYQESIEWFDKALFIDPKYKLALFSKGDSLRLMDQHKESIEWFDKAILIDPNYKLALFSKGNSLKMLGQYKESIEWFDKALLIDPKYKQALRGKGVSLLMLLQYNQALEYLDSALQIDNNYELALGSKGECLIELERFDEAEICLNKAVRLNPNSTFSKIKLKILKDKRKR